MPNDFEDCFDAMIECQSESAGTWTCDIGAFTAVPCLVDAENLDMKIMDGGMAQSGSIGIKVRMSDVGDAEVDEATQAVLHGPSGSQTLDVLTCNNNNRILYLTLGEFAAI